MGPVTEEFAFRACMLPLLMLQVLIDPLSRLRVSQLRARNDSPCSALFAM